MEHEPTVVRRGLRLIWRFIRAQPLVFTISIIGATIFAISAVGTTVILGRITDELITPTFREGEASRSALFGAVGALAIIGMLRGTSIVLRRYFAAMLTRRTQAQLRRGVVGRYVDVPMAYHHAHPTGELLAHADADVEASTDVINPLPFTIGVSVLIVFAVISLALVDPILTLVALVLFPSLAALNRVYTRLVEQPAANVQHCVGVVSGVAHESIDGAMIVKTLGRQAQEVARLAAAADELRRARIAVGRLRATFEPAIDAIPTIGVIVLLAVGSWQVSIDRISTGDLVQAMALFGLLAFPMRVVGYFLQEMPRSVVSMARIDGVLEEASAPGASSLKAQSLPPGPLGVAFRDVVFSYPGTDVEVLRELECEVEAGEIVAVVGSTGSGKSTLCDLLVRLDDPDAGAVCVGDVDLRDVDLDELRHDVAVVFQESFLFADSIRENVVLDEQVGDDALHAAARIARADGFIRALPNGYDTVVGERGVTLSGGQRQRVALARALVRQPRVLVLDDATSAVDPLVEAEILAGLREHLHTTTIVVAHRISTIELADRVLFIDDGRVAASGRHLDLLAIPAYEAIVTAYQVSR